MQRIRYKLKSTIPHPKKKKNHPISRRKILSPLMKRQPSLLKYIVINSKSQIIMIRLTKFFDKSVSIIKIDNSSFVRRHSAETRENQGTFGHWTLGCLRFLEFLNGVNWQRGIKTEICYKEVFCNCVFTRSTVCLTRLDSKHVSIRFAINHEIYITSFVFRKYPVESDKSISI